MVVVSGPPASSCLGRQSWVNLEARESALGSVTHALAALRLLICRVLRGVLGLLRLWLGGLRLLGTSARAAVESALRTKLGRSSSRIDPRSLTAAVPPWTSLVPCRCSRACPWGLKRCWPASPALVLMLALAAAVTGRRPSCCCPAAGSVFCMLLSSLWAGRVGIAGATLRLLICLVLLGVLRRLTLRFLG